MNSRYQDPVGAYCREYQKKFSRLAADFFQRAIDNADVDIRANAELAKLINSDIKHRDKLNSAKRWRIFFTIMLFVLIAVFAGYFCYALVNGITVPIWAWLTAALYIFLALFIIFKWLFPTIRRLSGEVNTLNAKISQNISHAREMLAPFFRQFNWDDVCHLIANVLPMVKFDPFMTAQRLREMYDFDLDEAHMADRSVLYTHSGTFYGYPFVFLNSKHFYWGEKTYTGSKEISWRETIKDSDGKYRTVTRSQTLTASLTKPYPEFVNEKCFLFGHDAAADLSFSRSPSNLSGKKKYSFWTSLKRKFKMAKLRRLEANLTDDSDYTMMSNREFELLFCSIDRDHEIQYRMLFTPLAQQYMVELLNDRKAGYGDDFTYAKSDKLTAISSTHLNDMPFDIMLCDDGDYDLAVIRRKFINSHENFFRSIYFTFAPLMTIPLYNEERRNVAQAPDEPEISGWELESIANYHGANCCAHPDSITDNLLKSGPLTCQDGVSSAQITATGFKGIEHTTVIAVDGNDGKTHNVAVDWVEYIEVSRTTEISALPGSRKDAAEYPDDCIFRRNIISKFPAK